jgi:tRNA A-37 threonylcarbamoyl transferase component Bud32
MEDLAGKTLGNYRIVERIGRGGMATVYKAYQPALERYVAIKVIHPHLAEEDEQFLKRFRREAKAVASLRHPNIVQVFDFGTQDGVTYMVMEYLEGPTLKAVLNELAQKGKMMPLEEVLHTCQALASALDYAHQQGMVHRDVKPANVTMTAKGDVILTDFGIARIVGGTQYTLTGAVTGTPAYMSPEQAQGERGDERSDIYALGVMLYEMVVGQVPFDADTPLAVIMKQISAPLPLPRQLKPDISEAVERVILKALAKDPKDRYQTVAGMSAALEAALAGRAAADVGQATEDVGQATEDAGQATEDAGQATEDVGQAAEDAGQAAEDAGQAAEVAGRAAQVAGPLATDDGVRPSEVAGPRPIPPRRSVPWVAISLGLVGIGLLAVALALVLGGGSDWLAHQPTATLPASATPLPSPEPPEEAEPELPPRPDEGPQIVLYESSGRRSEDFYAVAGGTSCCGCRVHNAGPVPEELAGRELLVMTFFLTASREDSYYTRVREGPTALRLILGERETLAVSEPVPPGAEAPGQASWTLFFVFDPPVRVTPGMTWELLDGDDNIYSNVWPHSSDLDPEGLPGIQEIFDCEYAEGRDLRYTVQFDLALEGP